MGLLSVLVMLMVSGIDMSDEDIVSKQVYVETLRTEIEKIDSEMLRCQKAKSGWTAATVVGGVGVVATGTAAIIQGVKLGKQNKERKDNQQKENK